MVCTPVAGFINLVEKVRRLSQIYVDDLPLYCSVILLRLLYTYNPTFNVLIPHVFCTALFYICGGNDAELFSPPDLLR